jgi:hypothetical protein
MLPFNNSSQCLGFSTGALERGDFASAVSWMIQHDIRTMELSALRFDELQPLVSSLDTLNLAAFDYISFHAPSSFTRAQEEEVIDLLMPVQKRGWNIIVHPDVIYTPSRWQCLGEQLLVENMDRRKAIGRTVNELKAVFQDLPKARLCLDVAHARQLDTTLFVLWDLVRNFTDRIAEIHISELDSRCRHQPMSRGAVADYQQVLGRTVRLAPAIVESMLDGARKSERMNEFALAKESLAEHESP